MINYIFVYYINYMTFVFEILLFLGFSAASFYIGYRYAIDFNPQGKQNKEYMNV